MPWLRIKKAAAYSGVSEKTLRAWLKEGRRHSRMPSGTVLINESWIDEYIEQFESTRNEADEIVNSLLRDLRGK